MTPHVLDQPIRNALITRHRHLAEGGPLALRYQSEISPLACVMEESEEAFAALGELITPGATAILVQNGQIRLPPGMVADPFEGVQMLGEAVTAPEENIETIALSDADAPEMLALATLTKPGPFLTRTHAFGGYVGIRIDGRLAAMAGHRLKVPGYTEISAVCTHPDFRGRGYASYLTRLVAGRIAAQGDMPFLHTYATNTHAIRLYETLGFVLRTPIEGCVLRRV